VRPFEADVGPDPPSTPLPRALALACDLLIPTVATAPAAWLAARRLRRTTFKGVEFLVRAGQGIPWILIHGLSGTLCCQFDCISEAVLGDARPLAAPGAGGAPARVEGGAAFGA